MYKFNWDFVSTKKGNTFKNIHTIFPSLLAKLSKEYNLKHLIHLSALGISEAKDSDYAKVSLMENEILNNFPLATILRPSIVYSVDDNFTTNFMTLLNRLPFFHYTIMEKLSLVLFIVLI